MSELFQFLINCCLAVLIKPIPITLIEISCRCCYPCDHLGSITKHMTTLTHQIYTSKNTFQVIIASKGLFFFSCGSQDFSIFVWEVQRYDLRNNLSYCPGQCCLMSPALTFILIKVHLMSPIDYTSYFVATGDKTPDSS